MKEHEYIGGRCIHCNQEQPVIKPKRTCGKTVKKITSEFQYMVDNLMTYFKAPAKEFPKWAYAYKILGKDRVLPFLSYCKERGIRSPKYFWGFYKRTYRKYFNK